MRNSTMTASSVEDLIQSDISDEDLVMELITHAGEYSDKELKTVFNLLKTEEQRLLAVKKRCAVKGEGSTACHVYHTRVDELQDRYYAHGDNRAGSILETIGELDGH